MDILSLATGDPDHDRDVHQSNQTMSHCIWASTFRFSFVEVV